MSYKDNTLRLYPLCFGTLHYGPDFYMDEHVIQGVTLAASLIMLVIALLTEVFIGRITQSVFTVNEKPRSLSLNRIAKEEP